VAPCAPNVDSPPSLVKECTQRCFFKHLKILLNVSIKIPGVGYLLLLGDKCSHSRTITAVFYALPFQPPFNNLSGSLIETLTVVTEHPGKVDAGYAYVFRADINNP